MADSSRSKQSNESDVREDVGKNGQTNHNPLLLMPNNNPNLQSNLLLLTQELPFANSTEFEVINNCLKNNDFLHCLENNNLSKKL